MRVGLISHEGGWQIDLYANNITDERAQVSQGNNLAYQWGRSGEYEHAALVNTVRPREYGMRFSYRLE